MQTATVSGSDGTPLFARRWQPEGEPRGVLLAIHGYAEHSGRMLEPAQLGTSLGLQVCAYDQRSHGNSPGQRGYVADFDLHVADAAAVIEQLADEFAGRPLFIFGHSFGGLVLARYAETHAVPARGLIFSSPFIAQNEEVSPLLVALAPVVSALTPWLPVLKLDSGALSRDPSIVKAYDEDPLVYHGPILARTGHTLNEAVKLTRAEFPKITAPLLVWHGDSDRLAPVAGGRDLYARASSVDKNYREWQGGYHELLHDLPKEEVLELARRWIEERM